MPTTFKQTCVSLCAKPLQCTAALLHCTNVRNLSGIFREAATFCRCSSQCINRQMFAILHAQLRNRIEFECIHHLITCHHNTTADVVYVMRCAIAKCVRIDFHYKFACIIDIIDAQLCCCYCSAVSAYENQFFSFSFTWQRPARRRGRRRRGGGGGRRSNDSSNKMQF